MSLNGTDWEAALGRSIFVPDSFLSLPEEPVLSLPKEPVLSLPKGLT